MAAGCGAPAAHPPGWQQPDWARPAGGEATAGHACTDGRRVFVRGEGGAPDRVVCGDDPAATTTAAPAVGSAAGPVYVRGYYRSNGTYVRPYTRSR